MTKESPAYIAHYRKHDETFQSLEEHLLGVAKMAESFASKIGLKKQGELIGLLHDLGKYSSEFQTYLKSAVGMINPDEDDFMDARGHRGKVDHSTAGAQFVWEELSRRGRMGQVVGQILALCIASHHSGLIDCLSSDASSLGEDRFTRRMQKSDDRAHLREAKDKINERVAKRADELVVDSSLINELIQSLKTLAENNKTDEGEGILQFKIGLLTRFLFSTLIDADRIDTADFETPRVAEKRLKGTYAEWRVLIDRLEEHLQGLPHAHSIDPIRRRISDQCRESAVREKGIYMLTVPTGGGKTLASLRFALHHAKRHGMDRVAYFIPFTSIIDQNADVVREILEPSYLGIQRGSIVLEHHSNVTPEEQTWESKILSENWDAPVLFTTNVQFLETLFGFGTRSARRMHQLANSVLIFDEIQTLPINCVHLFCNAINFLVEHCGSTVVLCTATQPLLDQVDELRGRLHVAGDSEIMAEVGGLFADLKRVEVVDRRKPGGWTNREVACLALEEAGQGNKANCLVIVNTKRSAREIYDVYHSETQLPVYYLTTNLCAAHRRERLGEIRGQLAAGKPFVCISTQLIEAGVDIDFRVVIRFLAGLDSIAQAAGRCNRHGRPELGRVYVVNPGDENIDLLKDIKRGRDDAARVFDEYEKDPSEFNHDLLSPKAIRQYFQYYFFDRRGDMAYSVPVESLGHSDTVLDLLSGNPKAVNEFKRCNRKAPELCLRQSFMAAGKAFRAINAPTRGVIVPYGEQGKNVINGLCAAFEPEKQFGLLREAQQYTVSVFPNELQHLRESGAVREIQEGTDILYLDARYYSQELGLSFTPSGEMEVPYG